VEEATMADLPAWVRHQAGYRPSPLPPDPSRRPRPPADTPGAGVNGFPQLSGGRHAPHHGSSPFPADRPAEQPAPGRALRRRPDPREDGPEGPEGGPGAHRGAEGR